jgi:hypothetical protein
MVGSRPDAFESRLETRLPVAGTTAMVSDREDADAVATSAKKMR